MTPNQAIPKLISQLSVINAQPIGETTKRQMQEMVSTAMVIRNAIENGEPVEISDKDLLKLTPDMRLQAVFALVEPLVTGWHAHHNG